MSEPQPGDWPDTSVLLKRIHRLEAEKAGLQSVYDQGEEDRELGVWLRELIMHTDGVDLESFQCELAQQTGHMIVKTIVGHCVRRAVAEVEEEMPVDPASLTLVSVQQAVRQQVCEQVREALDDQQAIDDELIHKACLSEQLDLIAAGKYKQDKDLDDQADVKPALS